MLERLKRRQGAPETFEAETREAAFEYFAGEIFDKAPSEHQQVLLATVFPSSITAEVAAKISGRADAGQVLEQLHRRHLFIERRVTAVDDRRSTDVPARASRVTYQYHALFREFLLSRARAIYTPLGLARLSGSAAQVLAESGLIEDAIDLYAQASFWDEVIPLLLNEAPSLLRQGRGQRLRDWIERLPSEQLDATPWLAYWYGTSLIWVDPGEAQRWLASVYDRFRTDSDFAGQIASVAGLLESYYFELSDDRRMDPWLLVMESLLAREPKLDTPEQMLRPYACMVTGLVLRDPGHPLLRACVNRVTAILDEPLEINHKINAAGQLLQYLHFLPDIHVLQRVTELIGPLVGAREVAPMTRMLWFTHLGYCVHLLGEYEQALEAYSTALEIGNVNGLPQLEPFVRFLCR